RSFLNKFLNTSKFVLPLMAAVLLYNSTHFNSPEQETAIEKIKQANPKNIVPEETNSEEDIIIDFNKNLSFEHVLNIVGNNEGFRPT